MASIWMQRPGKSPPRKLHGHLKPSFVTGFFKLEVKRLARLNGAKAEVLGEMEATLRWPNGYRVLLYIEPYSPPSAPEPGQPKIHNGRGIVFDKAGKPHSLKVPS